MKCFIYLLIFCSCLKDYVTSEVSQDFYPVLDSHHLVFEDLISCTNDESSNEEKIREFSKCILEKDAIKSNFTICKFYELIVTNGEEFKCDDAQPMKLENHIHLNGFGRRKKQILSLIAGEHVYLENGFEKSKYFKNKQEIGPKHYISVLLRSDEYLLYRLQSSVSNDELEAFASMSELYILNSEFFTTLKSCSEVVPFIAISICSISIVLVIYLTKQKLRSIYFGKCIIIYAVFATLSYLAFISVSFMESTKESTADKFLKIIYHYLQMSLYIILNSLSYQAYCAVKK